MAPLVINRTASTGATKILSPVARPINDLLAAPGHIAATVQSSLAPPVVATGGSGGGLPQSTALTGMAFNPPTPSGSNSPGLNTPTPGESESLMSKHWKWIAIVVVLLLALWYFYGGTGTTA